MQWHQHRGNRYVAETAAGVLAFARIPKNAHRQAEFPIGLIQLDNEVSLPLSQHPLKSALCTLKLEGLEQSPLPTLLQGG